MLTFKEIESFNQIHLSIHKPTLRYLDEFIKLRCAPDLLNLRLFPNAKEITESMAAFNAVRRNVVNDDLKYDDKNIVLLDIGCGNTPRTAALFAFRTKWDCVAIDPRVLKQPVSSLNSYNKIPSISNLTCFPTTFEEFYKINYDYENLKAIIICAIHAHIHFEEFHFFIKNIRKEGYKFPIYMIYIPCCKYADLIIQAHYLHNYTDYGIWSPKRDIYIYKSVYYEPPYLTEWKL